MPSIPELRLIHPEILVLLKHFDEFCVRNNISYTLDAGSLLGAIREHGFIPWDDDADIAMTRSQYEKFRDIARTGALGEGYTFREYASQHPRVWLRRKGKPGAWIDIFIFDSISTSPLPRKLKLLGCGFFLAFTKNRESMEVSRKADLHHGLKRVLLNVGYIMGKPFTARFKARLMNAFCKHAFCGNGKQIHRSNTMYSELALIFPADVMSEYVRVPFEDTELMITKRWHEILVASYGENYMTPVRFASHDHAQHKGFYATDGE